MPNNYRADIELFGVSADLQQFVDYNHAAESNLTSFFPFRDIPMIAGPSLPGIPLQSPALTQAASLSSGTSKDSGATLSRDGHPPSFGSVSSSPLALNPETAKPGSLCGQMTDDDQEYWLQALEKCEKLQLLAHGFGGCGSFQPDQERLRPQMDRFLKLEQHQTYNRDGLSSTLYSATSARSLLPSRLTCDTLVGAYINTFETVFRVLHIPSFLREYESFWHHPLTSQAIETDEPLLCKLIVILALGSTVMVSPSSIASFGPTEDLAYLQGQSFAWISYGKQWLTHHMGTIQRTSVNMAQVLCLLALVRHVHDDAERCKGILHPGDFDLARLGMQMGFHRDPLIRAPAMALCEVETRRRLWATMVELSLQHSLDEGLPSSLSPESFDCKPPSDTTDEELEGVHMSSALSCNLEALSSSTILVLLSRTQNLRLQCLHLANSPGAPRSYCDSHSIASELHSAHNANMDILRGMDKTPSEFQVQLLQIYTWQFVRALHEPFAEQIASHSSTHYSRKVRMEASVRVLGWPPSLALATLAEDEGPQATLADDRADACVSLRVYSQGYLSRVQRHAAVSLCLDLISELDHRMFYFSDGASWKRMCSIIGDTISIYERRLKVSLVANGKRELLFLRAAEAYINAILADANPRDVEEAIFRAIDGTISVCCEVSNRR